jgi:hypothetical protein
VVEKRGKEEIIGERITSKSRHTYLSPGTI